MIEKTQLARLIKKVISELGMYSPEAVQLLMGTAAQESRMGTYIEQIKGPARGIFQMEPLTELDIWLNYISYQNQEFKADFNFITGVDVASVNEFKELHLTGNIVYQIAMARLHYYRVSAQLPAFDNIATQAFYWKQYYNTEHGKGTADKYIDNYYLFADGVDYENL